LRVVVGGGTGFIGNHLCNKLVASGHSVTIISRTPGPGRVSWNQVNQGELPPCDAIVQLSGENIMQKTWTEARKKELLESRVGTTKILMKAISSLSNPPKIFVSGSAIGYYPTSSSEKLTFDEYYEGAPANNFSGQLVSEWEKEVFAGKEQDSLRRVVIRTGIVLGKGGALEQMLLPFKLGLGGRMGSGKQYWPWIHIDDITGIFQHSLETEKVEGILNGTAPHYVTNEEFAKTLAKVLNRPAIIPMPDLVLKLLFRERAFLLSEGHVIVPQRTLQSGYKFMFDNLEAALGNLVKKT